MDQSFPVVLPVLNPVAAVHQETQKEGWREKTVDEKEAWTNSQVQAQARRGEGEKETRSGREREIRVD